MIFYNKIDNKVFSTPSQILDCMLLFKKNIEFKQCINNYAVTSEKYHTRLDYKKDLILVIGGGISDERDISLMSAEGIIRALIDLGYQVVFIDIGYDIAIAISKVKPKAVFNALHGKHGEDGCIAGLLNIMQIPYTGSGILSSAMSFNKKMSNQILLYNNIKVAKSVFIKATDKVITDPINRPYVIKPLCQGSSIGVKVVFEEDKFSFQQYDFRYGNEIIVERYIKGRELQVVVLNGKAIGALEIKLLNNNRFYDYHTKYNTGCAEHIFPLIIPKKLYSKLLAIAEHVYRLFLCKSLIRVEFIYNEHEQELYLLELNTHPGMTPFSICPEIAAYVGISYNELVYQILKKADFE